MKKIIDLTENDLKRIVKKVLNERQMLNEIEPFTIGLLIAGGAALIGGSVAGFTWWNGSEASSAVKKLFDSCKAGMEGNPKQKNAEHRSIASKINASIEGWGTDEEALSSALASIKSVPDLCMVIKEYEISGFGNMYEEIDGDIDGSGWEKYVRTPLSNAVRATEEANKTEERKDDDESSTSGGEGSSTSGSGDVEDLQKLLKDKGFNPGDIDGAFGPNTLKAALKAVRSIK